MNWQDVLREIQQRGGLKIEVVDGGIRLSVTLSAEMLNEVLSKLLNNALQ